jgi:hypothetical protein
MELGPIEIPAEHERDDRAASCGLNAATSRTESGRRVTESLHVSVKRIPDVYVNARNANVTRELCTVASLLGRVHTGRCRCRQPCNTESARSALRTVRTPFFVARSIFVVIACPERSARREATLHVGGGDERARGSRRAMKPADASLCAQTHHA